MVNLRYLAFQQDPCSKYMVAASICEKGSENKALVAHETTLLPQVRGFGPLMAMIFAPSMDLKRDETKSRFVSLKTGLGYSPTKKTPLFEEHDNTFSLDFCLSRDDINQVCNIQYDFLPFYQTNFNFLHRN